jgi:hypothetical protein
MNILENLSEKDKKYLDSVKTKIHDLEKQQEELYNLAISTLKMEDSDEIFDYLYNDFSDKY